VWAAPRGAAGVPSTSIRIAIGVAFAFRRRGAEAGEIAHYVRADGAGGYTISDSDDLDAAYAAALAYSEIMTVTINPVLKVEDAVGPIFAYLG